MEHTITTAQRPLPKKMLKKATRKELITIIRVLERNLADTERALDEALTAEHEAQRAQMRAEQGRAQADAMMTSILDDLTAAEVQQEIAEATSAAVADYATRELTKARVDLEAAHDQLSRRPA